jgi:hypothetical protein
VPCRLLTFSLGKAENSCPGLERSGRFPHVRAHVESGVFGHRPVDSLLQKRGLVVADLLEALPAAVYLTDAAGLLTYYNRAAADFWGWWPDLGWARWCGSWLLFGLDGTPLPHDQCPMAVAIQQNRQVRGVEAVAARPDGTRVPFAPFPTPLRSPDGQLIGGVNMLIALSEPWRGRAVWHGRLPERRVRNEIERRASNLLMAILPAVSTILRDAAVSRRRPSCWSRLLAHRLMEDSGFGNGGARVVGAPGATESGGAARVVLNARRRPVSRTPVATSA